MMFAVDANFQLKRRARSEVNDYFLGNGLAYFVDRNKYGAYVVSKADDIQVGHSICSSQCLI
jgi:hypothetical protein